MYKTAIFKIHNPGTKKKAILEHAFNQVTLATDRILKKYENRQDYLRSIAMIKNKDGSESFSLYKLHALFISHMNTRNTPLHSTLFSSIAMSLAETCASYFGSLDAYEKERVPKPPSYPKGRKIHDENRDYLGALFSLRDEIDAERIETLMHEVTRTVKQGRCLPIPFARLGGKTKTHLHLLYDKTSSKYVALAHLLPQINRFHKEPILYDNLIDIRTNEPFCINSRAVVLFELEMGKTQEGFFSTGRPMRAFIKKKNDAYFLHVDFKFDEPPTIETDTVMGIDMNLIYTAGIAIINDEGLLLRSQLFGPEIHEAQIAIGRSIGIMHKAGRASSRKHFKRGRTTHLLHLITNEIIDLALQNRSQIVIEDLHLNRQYKYTRTEYKQLTRLLRYKIKAAGLPKLYRTFPDFTTKTCSNCGVVNKLTRNQTIYSCGCGNKLNKDINASINIARRLWYRNKDWEPDPAIPDDRRYFAFHREYCTLKLMNKSVA